MQKGAKENFWSLNEIISQLLQNLGFEMHPKYHLSHFQMEMGFNF